MTLTYSRVPRGGRALEPVTGDAAAPPFRPSGPGWAGLRLVVAAAEAALVTMAAVIAVQLLSQGRPGAEVAAVAATMAAPLIVLPFWVSGRYQCEQLRSRRSALTTGAWAAVLGGGLAMFSIQVGTRAGPEPAVWAAATWATVGAAVLLYRLVIMLWLRRQLARGCLARRVAVIAHHAPPDCEILARDLKRAQGQPCDLTFLPAPRRGATRQEVESIAARVRELVPHEILIVTMSPFDHRAWSRRPKMVSEALFKALQPMSCPVTVAWERPGNEAGFIFATLVEAALTDTQRLIKRACDLVGASAALLLLLPFFALLGVLIKLESPGPLFFVQKRRGLDNTVFDVLKFRSMHVDMCDPSGLRLTTRDDPRVTRVGAFIRRWSLDELPQLLNVIEGTMSLVGPRPHPLKAKAGERLYEEVVSDFALRYRVKPGMTGWAQVNGLRGNTDSEEKLIRRFYYDMEYIRRWSIWLDLEILIRTPLVSVQGENAY